MSEPEPDFALVPLELSEEGERHPGLADLVIEISDRSLTFDRNEKASLYAKAGIAEYWILNLRHQRLEVRDLRLGLCQPFHCGPRTIISPTLCSGSYLRGFEPVRPDRQIKVKT
jgi:Uma2 family endonuclease